MSVEQAKIVDVISIDPHTNEVILTISDHLEWDSDSFHLELLQDKLNAYLSFIKSGEINQSYPKAIGRRVVISIIAKYEPDTEGLIFLTEVKRIIEGAEIGFHFNHK